MKSSERNGPLTSVSAHGAAAQKMHNLSSQAEGATAKVISNTQPMELSEIYTDKYNNIINIIIIIYLQYIKNM